jgi:hypothetical protein
MQEPYATLFEGYEDHWFIGRYIAGDDEPDWYGLLHDERLGALSTGERILLDMAAWFAGPRYRLDQAHLHRLAVAMLLVSSGAVQ